MAWITVGIQVRKRDKDGSDAKQGKGHVLADKLFRAATGCTTPWQCYWWKLLQHCKTFWLCRAAQFII